MPYVTLRHEANKPHLNWNHRNARFGLKNRNAQTLRCVWAAKLTALFLHWLFVLQITYGASKLTAIPMVFVVCLHHQFLNKKVKCGSPHLLPSFSRHLWCRYSPLYPRGALELGFRKDLMQGVVMVSISKMAWWLLNFQNPMKCWKYLLCFTAQWNWRNWLNPL